MMVVSFRRIGHKIITVVGAVVVAGLTIMVFYYANQQEKSILAQNERTMLKVTESVNNGLRTVMMAGYADIAQEFAGNLRDVPEVADFRLMRANGLEAFKDNKTIEFVNEHRGEFTFFPRETEEQLPVLRPNHPELVKALETQEIVSYEETASSGERYLTYLSPIKNEERCQKCHGDNHTIRGVLKLTTSLAPVQRDIQQTRKESAIILAAALAVILIVTNHFVRRTVVKPIMAVTQAMTTASSGDLKQRVPVLSQDELGEMASSFNRMSTELATTYSGLHQEQNKLTTIILGAQEGIVVTDGANRVALVNPAAERLLGKTPRQIEDDGFMALFDDEELMLEWMGQVAVRKEPHLHPYNGRLLSVSVATIREGENGADGVLIGTSALIRDVTEEKRLEEELRRLSTTDALTQLFNRRHLDETLAIELERSERYGSPLSVIMFDVDHFKKFNDTHGHDQGDRVLQALAAMVRDRCRTVDIPCRYGGEEFLIILPATPAEGAQVLAEGLRQKIEQTPVDGLTVTISIGVGCTTDLAPKTPDAFVEHCDAALYAAKAGGRNRVMVAVADPDSPGEESSRKPKPRFVPAALPPKAAGGRK